MSSWIIAPLKTVSGGLLISFLLLVGTTRVQNMSRRFDRLCEDIRTTADLGVDYWFTPGSETSNGATEARILGNQELINSTLDSLGRHLNSSKRKKWTGSLEPFVSELTGGEFMAHDRLPDPDRARTIQIEMGKLVDQVRKLQASKLELCRFVFVVFLNR